MIDDRFLVRISNIPLEDLIACKLETLSHKVNGKMFGLSLARSIKKITQEALIKYARSVCQSNQETAMFLESDSRNISEYLRTETIAQIQKVLSNINNLVFYCDN